MSLTASELLSSARAVQRWVEEHDYKAYDPGDGLMSFLRPFMFGNRLAERILLQAIWKSPFNIRPLVGVKPHSSTKGRGFMAWGHLFLYRATGDPDDAVKARACLDWLIENRCRNYPGYSWGNHFDFVTRGGCIPAGTPTIVWSGLIGQAFLEAFETFQDERYLDVARGICMFILSLPREKTPTGNCLSYVPIGQSSIHNSNMLGGAMLARTWKHTHNEEYLAVARESMRYSCARQLPDGAWWYGEDPRNHWIDSFHTGYNLDCLRRHIDATQDVELESNLKSGFDYFARVFFEPSGLPRYYHNRTHPIDIQCAAQGIDTLAFFSDRFPGALEKALAVAAWTIANLQGRHGNFYFRKYPLMTARTAYLHWGQATSFKALSHLYNVLKRVQAAAPRVKTPA